ncbi:hypothetical protein AMK59_7101 [Oryctes borbonicus]|uniref:lysozyme n=1 Tax=Oryctes borbonicus TaxID=1629725 RepID=A0A0T6AUA2_9SCAR|nr:hypothetical protein AMK59_7101 [Oryctes borbonicus]
MKHHLFLALLNLINSDIHKCVTCLCHARTGCYSLQNCAKYSISYDYWTDAKAPTVENNTGINLQSYTKCIADDNCIIHTIRNYGTSYLGNRVSGKITFYKVANAQEEIPKIWDPKKQ